MRIENATTEDGRERRRVGADVVWEDVDRPPQRIFFETSLEFADRLSANPHAFLLGVAVPALRAGEARIAFEGALCPQLRDGLVFAMRILSLWYDPARRIPRLEPSAGIAPAPSPRAARTACFLSGGVDSLAMLRANLLDYPRDHPHAVRSAFFVEGFDIGVPGREDQSEFYERAAKALHPVLEETGIEVVPVHTNLRGLAERRSWPDEQFASGAAALAHAFSGYCDRALFAAGIHVGALVPHGSHPVLDSCFSSSELSFVSSGAHLRRVDKVRTIAGWDAALCSLRVCWKGVGEGAPLNCGRCHKCILTGLELLVAERLHVCPTLPFDDVSADLAQGLRATTRSSIGFFEELIEPCERLGRHDLARVLRRKILRIRYRNAPWAPRIGPLRRGIRRGLRRALVPRPPTSRG